VKADRDRAVFATRPHVRPLLALQRPPGYDMLTAARPGWQPAAEVPSEPQDGLTATGLQPCLAAVSQCAVALLIVPEDETIPGSPASAAPC
jgi:hypothetical protein